jgi:nitrate/TMAO reductase-like tetraheme cytochrome c subunit
MGAPKRLWAWIIDPNQRKRLPLVLLGALIASVGFMSVVYAWEYTSSPVFCGTTCHTMPPEYNAYQQSAHARVDCVTCHVSKGVNTAVMEKVTDMRHVILFAFQSYETPIVIKSLRPAREACEHCHWPEKFYSDRVVKIPRFAQDDKNTELDTYLILKTGGGNVRASQGYGIHWHVDNVVEFVSTDEFKQSIPWVRATFPDGKVVEYFDDGANITKAEAAKLETQRMECIDCHNRTAHYIKSPENLVDEALASGAMDVSLPAIKRKAVEALNMPVETRAKAIDALEGYYATTYPEVYAVKKEAVQDAVVTLRNVDFETSFPDLQEGWKTYANNVGHKEFPGCFRCHDGKHIAESTDVPPERLSIRLQCNVCHSIPETVIAGQQPKFTAIVPQTEPPFHKRSDWMSRHPKQVDATCVACHGEIKYNAKPTADNQSFCANISCHGAGWKKYIGLVEIQSPGVPPLPVPGAAPATLIGQPATLSGPDGVPYLLASHNGRSADTCLLCHDTAGVKPVPSSHVGRTSGACLVCHKPLPGTSSTPAAGAALPSPTKLSGSLIPALLADHAGRTSSQCLICHGPSGIRSAPDSHAGRTPDSCLGCHKTAGATSVLLTPALAATPSLQPATGGVPPALLASHVGRPQDTCLACHGPTGPKPAPVSHSGRTAETCLLCHKAS